MSKKICSTCSLSVLLIGLLTAILVPSKAQSTATQSPVAIQRKTRVLKPRRVPIEVSAVRNLNDPNWLDNLEIEIRNLSDKPIYYMRISLHFPDLPESNEIDGISRDPIIVLSCGRSELMQAGKAAQANDVPILAKAV